jgi:hypothetical protein
MTEKLFSPGQANAALPLVRQIVSDIVGHQKRLADLAGTYKTKKKEPGVSQVFLNEAKQELANVTNQRDACVAELADLGVQIKDAATGLIDFPAKLDGASVLLCWRLGEDRVEFFHTETDGFGGRRPIPEPVHAG